MGLRPARCYRAIKRPYTRKSRQKSKDYVKGIPEPKIHRYEMGAVGREFAVKLSLVCRRPVQIRHNALEAARVALIKNLEKRLPKDGFFLKILVYPHHVLRENVLATGAGADRFQSGMRLSFGKPIGIAAQVRADQKLLAVSCDAASVEEARKSLKIAGSKMPTPCYVVMEAVAVKVVAQAQAA